MFGRLEKMLIFALPIVFLFSLTWTEADASRRLCIPPPNNGCPLCYDKCIANPDFTCPNCTDFQYLQFSPCFYYCICTGTLFNFYQEPDFTKCGSSKFCMNGDCLRVAKDNHCYKFGDCYIGLEDNFSPCTYTCYNTIGCDRYSEDYAKGTDCANPNGCGYGRCNSGVCAVKDANGCVNNFPLISPLPAGLQPPPPSAPALSGSSIASNFAAANAQNSGSNRAASMTAQSARLGHRASSRIAAPKITPEN